MSGRLATPSHAVEAANDSVTSLHSSPRMLRPQSDRADDMLPKGTVFRWNPYAATPTNNSFGPGAAAAPGGGATPGNNAVLAATGPNPSRSALAAAGAPVHVVSPRAEAAAAAGVATTPLADGTNSPMAGAGFIGLDAATVDPETGEPLPRRVIEVSPTTSLASDSVNPVARTLVRLIEEPRDSAIRDQVLAMPQNDANVLYCYFARAPDVAEFLCLKHRGKIFADVIEAAAGALDNADLFRWLAARLERYSVDQSGCIAVTRVYDIVRAEQRAIIDDFVAMRFSDLAGHQFGNYVVQRVIASGDVAVIDAIGRQLRSRGVVATLTTSKAGSHVVERYVAKAPIDAALPICQLLVLGDPEFLAKLANDRYGNYVVQAALKKIFEAKRVLEESGSAGLAERMSTALPQPQQQQQQPNSQHHHHHQQQPQQPQFLAAHPGSANGSARATPRAGSRRGSANPETLAMDVAAAAARCLTEVPPIVANTQHAANIHRAMGLRFAAAPGTGGGAGASGGGKRRSVVGGEGQQSPPASPNGPQGNAGATQAPRRGLASALRRGPTRR